jgi:hypothetical protein
MPGRILTGLFSVEEFWARQSDQQSIFSLFPRRTAKLVLAASMTSNLSDIFPIHLTLYSREELKRSPRGENRGRSIPFHLPLSEEQKGGSRHFRDYSLASPSGFQTLKNVFTILRIENNLLEDCMAKSITRSATFDCVS